MTVLLRVEAHLVRGTENTKYRKSHRISGRRFCLGACKIAGCVNASTKDLKSHSLSKRQVTASRDDKKERTMARKGWLLDERAVAEPRHPPKLKTIEHRT